MRVLALLCLLPLAALAGGLDRLRDKFGDIETPGISGEGQELMVQARVRVELGLKAQMAPKKQPADEFYFSTFMKSATQGKEWYRVVVNIDPPHR